MNLKHQFVVLFFIVGLLTEVSIISADESTTKEMTVLSEEDDDPFAVKPESGRVFSKNYVSFGLTRNFPVTSSRRRFAAGENHPIFSYQHITSDRWLNSISAQFKMLEYQDSDEKLALFSLNQESSIIFRIYHPNYFLVGTKVYYFLPSKKGMIPLQKKTDLETEIGAGLSLGIFYLLTDHIGLKFYVDRWRGTKTRKLQGIETGTAVMYGF